MSTAATRRDQVRQSREATRARIVAAAAMLAGATRLRRVTVVVIAVSLVTQAVYPWSATQLVTGESSGVITQVVRIVLLVTATVMAVVAIGRRSTKET